MAVALALMLSACASWVRQQADGSLQAGQYEKAIATLEEGLKRHPDSPTLRAGLIQAKNEAMARLVSQAAVAKAAGKVDDARTLLQRAQPFDTGGRRVDELLAELDVEGRQRELLAQAEGLVAKQQNGAALALITASLKDNPRQPDLVALKRKIESSARQARLRTGQLGLKETRPISLDFRDASLRTVLDVVTRNSGVNFVLDKDVRADVRITVFLRSARVEDAIDLIVSTHQLTKKVLDEQTLLIYPNTPEKQREHQEQIVKVFYLASADAKGAAAFLRSMLRLKDPYVDERSNLLAVRDTPENIEMAERLLALYDTPEPEVLLEVEVIEVRSSRLTELGVKYPEAFSLLPLAPDGGSDLTLGNIRGLNRDRVALGLGGVLVNLKREVGDFNTLANPRIRARNKEKAKVLIGDKVPVITVTTGTGNFISDSVSYVDVGLKLDVEPTVYADDEVAIKVGLEVSSVSREITTRSGTLAYQIGTRNANTVLRLRDGETQLLAGLISKEERSNSSRIPGLGDLPIAGRLFSNNRDDNNRTELVLAITPRILRNVRIPDATETEIWVGTETQPRLRNAGGTVRVATEGAEQQAPAAAPAAAASGPSIALGAALPPAAIQAPAPAAGASAAQAPATLPTTMLNMTPAITPSNGPSMTAPPTLPPPTLSATPPGAPAASSTTPTTLRWAGPVDAAVGSTFTVALHLTSPTPLRGMPLRLAYPKDKLTLVDVDEGDFFKQDTAATSFSKQIDAKEGTARVGLLRSQATAARGQGTVITARFKALAPGAAEIRLLSMDPVAFGEPTPRIELPRAHAVQINK
jgi:general secretion pathway protein D